MKRRGFKPLMLIVLLISGGAIVNIAGVVAVSLGTWPGDSASVLHEPRTVSASESIVMTRFGIAETQPEEYGARGFGWTNTTARANDGQIKGFVRVFDAGWPLRAMQGEWRRVYGDQGETESGFKHALGRSQTRVRSVDVDIIPLLPIWPGFAINTIFYAAILWGVFALPGKARRYFRGKRGLCPACAYPIGTSIVCTECGGPIPAVPLRRSAGM